MKAWKCTRNTSSWNTSVVGGTDSIFGGLCVAVNFFFVLLVDKENLGLVRFDSSLKPWQATTIFERYSIIGVSCDWMSPNCCKWNPCWSTLTIFFFPIRNIFGTLSQPDRAWAVITEETISVTLLAVLLMSTIDLLLANASISTRDSIKYFNTFSVRSTKTLVPSQITLINWFFSIAQDIHCLTMLSSTSSWELLKPFLKTITPSCTCVCVSKQVTTNLFFKWFAASISKIYLDMISII